MATTYTANYHLGKQTDHTDKFSMQVITDNMDTIDTQMKANADAAAAVTPSVESSDITTASIATFYEGTKAGKLSTEISGTASQIYGVVRAYKVSSTDAIQIVDGADGTHRTRYYTSGAWGEWLYTINPTIVSGAPPLTYTGSGNPIIDWEITGAAGGVGDAVSSDNIYHGALQEKFYSPTNGQEQTGVSNVVSNVDLLPVNGGTQYTAAPHFTGATSGYWAVFIQQFDSNMNFLTNNSNQTYCTVTTNANTRYVRLMAGLGSETVDLNTVDDFMLNLGSTPETYEPYASGYNIPITVTDGENSTTVTINTDTQLGAGDKLTSAQAGVSIPTYNGENTLSVGTTVQPASVKIALT